MRHVKVLDCTLRDGGYLIDAVFGDETIKGMIQRFTNAGINVIECGFLKDEPHKKNSTIFSDVDEVREYLPENKTSNTSYVLLADYSRYKADNLKPYDGTSIDGIRECFQKHERKDAMRVAKIMKDKGYKVYIQPVDIMGYSDSELLELISWVNELKPYSFSMVDTFGSMYSDDLQRLYSLVHHNLDEDIFLGFHSHNNLQLSFSLTQEFIKMSLGQREVIVDSTICGMGRGAGNTHTELVVDYLNRKLKYTYDLDILLDIVDIYIPHIMKQCKWGYSIPNFIAGINSTHVHNISYLIDKHNIDANNMRKIIEKIDPQKRKEYDYDNLENIYIEHFNRNIDDTKVIERLKDILNGKEVLLIAPGNTINTQKDIVKNYITRTEPVLISVNGLFDEYKVNFAFFSNFRRFEYCKENKKETLKEVIKIVTSNVVKEQDDSTLIVNYNNLLKQGWVHFDNSTIMLLRLLLKLGVDKISLAGFDGYNFESNFNNYSDKSLEIIREQETFALLNKEISEMLKDIKSYQAEGVKISFITDSIYSEIFN